MSTLTSVIINNKKQCAKALYLLVFVALQPLELLSMELENHKSNVEARVITDHYLPADIWLVVADFLKGKDLFLNTDLSRRFVLDAQVKNKIFRSFIKRVKKLEQTDKVKLINSFYKNCTVNQCLHNWALFFGQLDSALETCDAQRFHTALIACAISETNLQEIMRFLLVKASALQSGLKNSQQTEDSSHLSKKNITFYVLIKFYLCNKIVNLGRTCEGTLLFCVIPTFVGLNLIKHVCQLYSRRKQVNKLINSENLALLCLLYSVLSAIDDIINKLVEQRKQNALEESQKIIDLIHQHLE